MLKLQDRYKNYTLSYWNDLGSSKAELKYTSKARFQFHFTFNTIYF